MVTRHQPPLARQRRLSALVVAAWFAAAVLLSAGCAGTGLDSTQLADASVVPDTEATAVDPSPAPGGAAEEVLLAQTDESTMSTASSVWLADLTWNEVADRLAAGWSTIIVPTGGIEQNGPHLAIDKHNVVVEHTAGEIARRAGQVLVAPVMDYVPEGDPAVMDDHLRWTGTISVPDATFGAVLDATARSLIGHGFTTVLFLGDSGSSQATQIAVAQSLTSEFGARGVTVANMSGYYSGNGQIEWLISQGEAEEAIGIHAGIRDTSEVLALQPGLVRTDIASASTGPPGTLDGLGVDGDPTRATASYGETLLELKIAAGVAEIQAMR